MEVSLHWTHSKLQEYSRQLLITRKLARYHDLLYANFQSDLSKEQKRAILVEKVATQIFENLIFNGGQQVVEVKKELEKKTGEKINFFYPAGEKELLIAKDDNNKSVPLSEIEKEKTLKMIWGIIVARVNATML